MQSASREDVEMRLPELDEWCRPSDSHRMRTASISRTSHSGALRWSVPVAVAALLAMSCGAESSLASGAVGSACIPDEENRPGFYGYDWDAVFVETNTPKCRGEVCLVAYFQGRQSCPYGQEEPSAGCKTTDGTQDVTEPVPPQLEGRPANDAVYCSCRCAGPDPNGDYCECPTGFDCEELIPAVFESDPTGIAGSYCVKSGTVPPPRPGDECNAVTRSCG